MTNQPYTILDKVAGARQVLSVLKRVQEAKPDASPSLVWRATRLAVMAKLGKLSERPAASLSANQVLTLHALEVADTLLVSFGSIFGDDETTRMLDPEERATLVVMAEKRKAAAKLSAAKRKAKKDTAPAGAVFAKA